METFQSPTEKNYRKYKQYFEYYKSADSKIEALNSLSNIQSRIKQRKQDLEELINSGINDLKFVLETLIERKLRNSDIEPTRKKYLKQNGLELLNKFQKDILQVASFHQAETIKEGTLLSLDEHSSNFIDGFPIDTFKKSLDQIIVKVKLHLNSKYHYKTIDNSINEIIDKSYPSELSFDGIWNLKHQRAEFGIQSNELSDKQEERKKEINEYYLDKIIEEAEKLLDKNNQKCITKSGNATTFLYKNVHKKLSIIEVDGKTIKPPCKETVRNRLNDFIKNSW